MSTKLFITRMSQSGYILAIILFTCVQDLARLGLESTKEEEQNLITLIKRQIRGWGAIIIDYEKSVVSEFF